MQPDTLQAGGYDPVDWIGRFVPAFPEWFDLLGLMGWPLVSCALIVLAVSFERIVFFLRLSVAWKSRRESIEAHVQHLKKYPKALRDESISHLMRELHSSFISGVGLLRTISVISPMLGLLGTILGIISAFKVIAAQSGPVSPNMIADGLWEAMLTTAVGLLIALPAIMAASVFRYLSEKRLEALCSNLNRLSMSFEFDKHDKSGPYQADEAA